MRTFPVRGVGKSGRGSAWADCGAVQRPLRRNSMLRNLPQQKGLIRDFLYHVGSLFPSVNVNGEFSACISLDLFSFQSFASALPFCLMAHYFAL